MSAMGLRSVFDSSFDEVVRVDYLDFEDAKRLLRRYVIGLSEQFLALAYVLSGGLARQLVRVARAIIEHGRRNANAPLASVARELVRDELTKSGKATVDALVSAEDRAGVVELLSALDDLPEKVTADELRVYARRLAGAYRGADERSVELRNIVAARVQFLAMVLDVFTDGLTRERMSAIGGGFDTLARARRYLAVNPMTGLALIDKFGN
jgi:hypothetical protein